MKPDPKLNKQFDLSLDEQESLDRELREGETLLWADKPKPVLFRPQSIGAFLFAIPWTGFAIFWVSMAIWMTAQAPGPAFFKFLFPAFGIPFILIGLGMLSTPYWDLKRQQKTVYAMTDQRAIIFSGLKSTKIQTFEGVELVGSTRTVHRDGTGDIRTERGLAFERIDRPDLIQDLIEELARQYVEDRS